MTAEYTLIQLYLDICDAFDQKLAHFAVRLSPNQKVIFTDEEIVCVYLFGLLQNQPSLKQIYTYTCQHWKEYFPQLPSYSVFCDRLNRLEDALIELSNMIAQKIQSPELVAGITLLDSMPIMLAKASRSFKAKVAPGLADKGYCASKDVHYRGVKLHVLGQRIRGGMPKPLSWFITEASMHDLNASQDFLSDLHNLEVFTDKAYVSRTLSDQMKANGSCLQTPIKRKKGEERLDYGQRLHSKAVRRVRQPIESLFAWIENKVSIQDASKVRSEKGLIVHIFGRLCCAFYLFANS